MPENIVLFEKEEESKKIILGYISEYPEVVVENVFDDYHAGIKYLKTNKPRAALFSMTEDKQTSFKMIKRLSDLGINVIVLSEDYTTSNIIQTLRYGAKDFVSKPVIKKELLSTIGKCTKEEIKIVKKSQIISVFSNKGGIGKTAIATNLAVELSRLTRDKVALVDLNLPMGDVTTFLDLKPAINISEIIDNSSCQNKNFIIDACQRYKDTSLYVLAEPPYLEQSHNLNPSKIVKLFDCLRNAFSYIVVDMGASIDNTNIPILENSDTILLVTIINLPLIRNCQRCLDMFEGLKFPADKTKIVVNRYIENDEITVSDVESAINKQIYWKIPNNYYTIMSSINKGIPVCEVNENSNVTESFNNLASKILEDIFETNITE